MTLFDQIIDHPDLQHFEIRQDVGNWTRIFSMIISHLYAIGDKNPCFSLHSKQMTPFSMERNIGSVLGATLQT